MSKMPELPVAGLITVRGNVGYTAQQMHDYARAYAESEAGRLREAVIREAIAALPKLTPPSLRDSVEYHERYELFVSDMRWAKERIAALAPKEK